jgi:hypothetical protein
MSYNIDEKSHNADWLKQQHDNPANYPKASEDSLLDYKREIDEYFDDKYTLFDNHVYLARGFVDGLWYANAISNLQKEQLKEYIENKL